MKRKQGIHKERNRRLSDGKESAFVRYKELCLLSDGKDPVLDGKDPVLDGKDPMIDGKDHVSDRKDGILSDGKKSGSIKSSSFFPL